MLKTFLECFLLRAFFWFRLIHFSFGLFHRALFLFFFSSKLPQWGILRLLLAGVQSFSLFLFWNFRLLYTFCSCWAINLCFLIIMIPLNSRALPVLVICIALRNQINFLFLCYLLSKWYFYSPILSSLNYPSLNSLFNNRVREASAFSLLLSFLSILLYYLHQLSLRFFTYCRFLMPIKIMQAAPEFLSTWELEELRLNMSFRVNIDLQQNLQAEQVSWELIISLRLDSLLARFHENLFLE